MKPDEPIAQKNIIARGLPKTGQVTEYQVGDDGTYEAGWWVGRLNANNRTRFISLTIGGDDIVLDRATGLMWAADGTAAGGNNGAVIAWANAVTYCNGLNFAGFTDWRLPNINELQSIINHGANAPATYAEIINTVVGISYWSGTTLITLTTQAWGVSFNVGADGNYDKVLEKCLRAVRLGV